MINNSVNSLQTILERRDRPAARPLPFSKGTVLYSSGLDIPDAYWKTLSEFPEHFNDKLLVMQTGLDDPRKKAVNDQLVRKMFSISAAFLGYSPSGRGFKMPKTRIDLNFSDFENYNVSFLDTDGTQKSTAIMAASKENAIETVTKLYHPFDVIEARPVNRYAGTHVHDRAKSWSHTIELNVAVALEDSDSFFSLMRTLTHELIHAQQHTKRRFTRNSAGQMMWDRQNVEIIAPEDDHDAYRNSPWEVEAHSRAPEVTSEIMSFLRSGVAKGGFNPKRI